MGIIVPMQPTFDRPMVGWMNAVNRIGYLFKTPFDYGAFTDGTNDDSLAFQRFFNDTENDLLYVPASTYRMATKVVIPNGCKKRVFGAGPSTILQQPTSVTNTRMFEYGKTAASSANSSFVEFDQLAMDGTGATPGTATNIGVWWNGFDQTAAGHEGWLRMSNCHLYNFTRGVSLKWTGFSEFDAVAAINNGTGFYLDRDASFVYFTRCVGLSNLHSWYCDDTVGPNDGVSNGLFFVQCQSVGCSLEDIYVNGWQTVWFDQCTADFSTGGVAAVAISNCQDWHWHGGWIASEVNVATRRGLWCYGAVGAGSHTGSVVGTTFKNSYVNLEITGVAGTGTKIAVTNNKFETANVNSVNHIYLDANATGNKITDNHIQDNGFALAFPIACGAGVNYNVVRHNTWGKAAGAWFPPAGIGAASLADAVNNIFGAVN